MVCARCYTGLHPQTEHHQPWPKVPIKWPLLQYADPGLGGRICPDLGAGPRVRSVDCKPTTQAVSPEEVSANLRDPLWRMTDVSRKLGSDSRMG